MKVYVVSSVTESGDEYLYVWAKRPSTEDILKRLFKDMPHEFCNWAGKEHRSLAAAQKDDSGWTINAPDDADEVEVIE